MKVGDLVNYGSWYNGKTRYGLIVEADDLGFVFVIWNNSEPEWEEKCELVEVT